MDRPVVEPDAAGVVRTLALVGSYRPGPQELSYVVR
jgi:hypothetical protein